MTIPFTNDTLVKDIVNELPKTSDVFKKYRIDFCCGGNIPLHEAASKKAVNLDDVLQELKELYQREIDRTDNLEVWTSSSSSEIINHIKTHYHHPLMEELIQLTPYVLKVSKVHGNHHPELLKVYELFTEFKEEMIEHTEKEEKDIFPLLLKLESMQKENKNKVIAHIQELEKEHDYAGSLLAQLRDVTSDYKLPAEACGTYTLVYKRLEALESETFMHVHLENNILFPRYM
ncbi:iron-sulfur cluster repair di-iron protein [Virgibacillus sp. LDC-1]|uniref:iron-sulfur cluster repair di-iron protein n=1 Tax=Virgibacillus sp. LDC-1 TaxID=3039856 RepID=UPI0024DEE823|nr:iron-sulfur cluster repair di-iron protein [Virgibacillus sp. LDC-1]